MSASDTSISSKPQCRITDDDHDHAADDHVDAARLETGIVTAAGDRLGRERAEDLLGGGARQAEVMDALALARVDAELDRAHRPHRARGADQRLRVRGAGNRAVDVGEMVAHDRHRDAQLLGGRRIGVQELLGEAHAADVDRDQAVGTVGADDELGRAAADVDHEVRLGLGEPDRRARELEARLLLAAEELGPHAEQLLDRIEEVVAVGGVARRAGRGGAHAGDAVTRDRFLVLADDVERARDRFGVEPAGLVHALAEPRDPRAPVDRGQRRPSTVDLGDEQPHGVGSDVDRGNRVTALRLLRAVRRHPPPDGIVTAREMPRVVRVQAFHAALRAADTAVRTRAGVIGGNTASRSAAYRSCARELAAVDRGLGRARHPSTRCAATRVTSTGSTSQKRVGIGVPSSRSGELRITIGAPASSRTTISNAPRRAPEQDGERSEVGVGRRHISASLRTKPGAEQRPDRRCGGRVEGWVVVVDVGRGQHVVGLLARQHHVELLRASRSISLGVCRRFAAAPAARSGALSTATAWRRAHLALLGEVRTGREHEQEHDRDQRQRRHRDARRSLPAGRTSPARLGLDSSAPAPGSVSFSVSISLFVVAHGVPRSRECARTGVRRGFAEVLLDAQELVVLRDAIAARGRAGLDLAAAGRDREVGDRRVLGLAAAVRHHGGVAARHRQRRRCRASR